MTKLQQLADIEGFGDEYEMMEETGHDSIVPCICTNRDCDFTAELEMDCQDGYCEECKTHTVKSFAVLMGII